MSVAERPPAPAERVEERHDASGRGAAFSSPATAGTEQLRVVEPLIFERSRTGRRAVRFPAASDGMRQRGEGQPPLPSDALRAAPPRLPEVSELELLRHYNRLAHLNQAIDLNFYPLGSCTMKYNPKLNEWAARLPGLAESHPLDPEALSQGSLELMWLLAELLRDISGFAAVSLQPAAGAHGELTGLLMARAYHRANGEGEQRTKVLVPDSAHGTNPASPGRKRPRMALRFAPSMYEMAPASRTAATTWSIWSSKMPSVDGFVIMSAATSGPRAARSASRSIPPRSFERIVTAW